MNKINKLDDDVIARLDALVKEFESYEDSPGVDCVKCDALVTDEDEMSGNAYDDMNGRVEGHVECPEDAVEDLFELLTKV